MTTSYRNTDPRPAIMQGSPPALVPSRMNWDRPPWNRWSFQHMRELVPTVEVARGRGPVRALPRQHVDLDHLPVTGIHGAATNLADLLNETYTDGFLVIKNGTIACEQYFNGMDERTLHLSQSVAKSVTGTTAGMLVAKGLLDPTKPVTDYLPELAATAWKGATLQQVMDMTTGVTFSEEYTDPYSEIGQLDVACGWKPIPSGGDPTFQWPTHVWELITRCTISDGPHGATFHYRSIETDVLAFAMERATGKRLAQLVSEELWQGIGAERNACFTVDSAGYALADGGFNATLRDYGRFALKVLENAPWIETTRNGNHAMFPEPYCSLIPGGAYHNQFWIENAESRNLMCQGVFGQFIYIDFKNQMVLVKLSTWPDFVIPEFVVATSHLARSVARHLSRT